MIPDYQSVMLPLLNYAGDKEEHHIRDAIEGLADEFKLTEEERKELLPSGLQAIFNNRVGWANTYLKKAGLLESTRRGYFRISDKGLIVLEKPPKEINVNYLEQYQEFIDFRGASKPGESELDEPLKYEDTTPEELIGIGHQKLQADLASELLDRIKDCSPSFFEKLVVELLVKMGYGGSRQDAGKAIGKSHDEGIDGIIKEDKLGLDIVYIQAKKWENPVSRPEIQKFAGALQGKRAKKGIFITTSKFSKSSIEYVSRIENKIILIDGEQLAKLMIEHDVGVSTIASYTIKKTDSDYFVEA
ncbi:MAG: Restriction endonuclease [Candidatus Methanolliviera sp. GoM_oil]|nr:MAG: Restriction endonuclease [Candidatus Methanolliviera sp. GoM_oil]